MSNRAAIILAIVAVPRIVRLARHKRRNRTAVEHVLLAEVVHHDEQDVRASDLLIRRNSRDHQADKKHCR
jgi:hypothetical protein